MVKHNFEELFHKRQGSIKPGLDRIRKAYETLQRPADDAFNVLVAGTNGKGGTSGFLWMLLASSQQVGLFTSPHLRSFAERFQVSGMSLGEEDVYNSWKNLAGLLTESYDELSFFELSTLIAFDLFETSQTSCNIFEVGLGGRLDSTNVVEPSLSIVTSISRDHEEFLGSDLIHILKEKLGICRVGIPLFWGNSGEVLLTSDYQEHIISFAKEKKNTVVYDG